jgi:hypothetical protein
MKRLVLFGVALLLSVIAASQPAAAQADEIQVYDGGLAPRGTFNLTVHNNFTVRGIKTPSFVGGVTPDGSFNGVPEWALGVTDWFEAGLYLPLYTHDKTLGFGMDGAKLRLLFAVPKADDRTFVYGTNFEFSLNAKRWDTHRVTSEMRGIVGWRVSPALEVILNPIFDTAYDGFKHIEFVPAARVAYNASKAWSLALESYSSFGSIGGLLPAAEQSHQLFGVVDHTTTRGYEIEFGAGVGLTNASDKLTLKLIVSKDLNSRK